MGNCWKAMSRVNIHGTSASAANVRGGALDDHQSARLKSGLDSADPGGIGDREGHTCEHNEVPLGGPIVEIAFALLNSGQADTGLFGVPPGDGESGVRDVKPSDIPAFQRQEDGVATLTHAGVEGPAGRVPVTADTKSALGRVLNPEVLLA